MLIMILKYFRSVNLQNHFEKLFIIRQISILLLIFLFNLNYPLQLIINNYLTGSQNSIKLKEKNQTKPKSQKQKNASKANKNYYFRKNRAKPVLSQEAQQILADWICGKMQQNIYVRRKDIAQKARKLSNHSGFSASKGWVNRYLGRHPQLRAELNKIARANKGKRRNGEFQQSSNSEQFDQVQKILAQNGQQNLMEQGQHRVEKKLNGEGTYNLNVKRQQNYDNEQDEYVPSNNSSDQSQDSESRTPKQSSKKGRKYQVNLNENRRKIQFQNFSQSNKNNQNHFQTYSGLQKRGSNDNKFKIYQSYKDTNQNHTNNTFIKNDIKNSSKFK